MQKLQDSVYSIVKITNLSPAVFSYLQPSEDFPDKTPLGGILSDTKHGWLALGPKFCVVDLRTGLKVAQRTFGAALSNFRSTVTSVVELPTPLTDNSQQLLISLECEDIAGMICVFHINGSQILRCIQTEVVVTELQICDGVPDGPFTCFDGAVMAGTKSGEIFVFDLNRSSLIQALKDISQGYEHMVRGEENSAGIAFLPLNAVPQIETQRDLALENDDHIAVLLNESSLIDGQYILRNPDGTVRMKAKRDHIRVTVIQYIPQLASLAVGFNFGAFQLWNMMSLDLEFTSQVNVECLPVTHFGFQEPCDDPRAFCYLWAVFSVLDRFDEEEFPLAVMYSLTYQGKRMLSDTKCLYQEFLTATIRFQLELAAIEDDSQLIGGRCVSCHTYSVNSMLGGEGEESMLNICQLIWECWGENANSSAQYGMLMFDLDQWYKDQMPATYPLQSNTFMSATRCTELARGATATLDVRLVPTSVSVYCAATRLEEHFYPNSLRYDCICLNTSEACVLSTTGIQRQIINSLDEVGPTALLNPTRLYHACVQTGLVPLCMDTTANPDQEEQRRYLLSVALEARLSRFLKRCAHDWATGSHVGAGCTLPFLMDWCWKRAIELKENARELTAPLFTSSALPDRNVVRCLEHCVQQLSQLTGLLDAVLTKCCNLVVPDALSEMEEKFKGIGTVSLYFQVVQWFLRVGLLPERHDSIHALPYPGQQLVTTYNKRRLKLHRLQDHNIGDENAAKQPCPLLYIDQLLEQEFGGERIHQMWLRGGSESNGLYPPPSLYSLLRLYLLPDIAEEHKHSLVLYLLVDYSMVYDEVRYEAVIRRLMQFPTMFGLSNTAIKATQAFWHLDHRDFDFALDQLQCLTGNTLSDWQHNVVLSSLLAQKKTQAALQYLHVRKPAPIQSAEMNQSRVSDHDKLDDWQSCCNLYLARGLVFEALDVIRMCVQNAASHEDKAHVLNFFFKGCRNSGQLSKLLQVTLLPFEEEIFIRYLENCNESQTSDILIMYYLQQARYLEAEQYNNKIKTSKPRAKNFTASLESLADILDREGARDTLVEVVCSSLPDITNTVAHSIGDKDWDSNFMAPKPMSVFVQARSPKNTFTYKSSFIQDTIENASGTWLNKPRARKGLKRALNIEDTPFICTPKLSRSRNIFTVDQTSETTPSKRARLDLTGTPKTPRMSKFRVNDNISQQMAELLDMPEVQSPDIKLYDRRGADTPHSILKIRNEALRDAASPTDSRYLGDSDDELLETASNHTHYSDSTNKHLRFTIPTASESGSTPSPIDVTYAPSATDKEHSHSMKERDFDMSVDSYVTTESHAMTEPHPLESPPKKIATEEKVTSRKTYKDTVRGRRSLSLSINSSLSDDPNTSVESIADIPITLINPRYRRNEPKDTESIESCTSVSEDKSSEKESSKLDLPKTPTVRKGIRAVSGESTPLLSRSRSVTPERIDSPIAGTPTRLLRSTRSRSRTPDISPRSSPLAPIPEQPKQEKESDPHPERTTLSIPRPVRSRSRTPERIEKVVESPRLEAISESPTKASESPTKSSDSPVSSPTRRNLRSRSHTPETDTEKIADLGNLSPRTLRRRAKTPEKLMSPKKDAPKSAKKPLARMVLEANAFAASKNLGVFESKDDDKQTESALETAIECTPMKALKSVSHLMDVTISPIVSKSVLHSTNESELSESVVKETKSVDDSVANMKYSPDFTMNETKFGKSVLQSYESSVAEVSRDKTTTKTNVSVSKVEIKSIPAFTLSESYFEKSVLRSYQSSITEVSVVQEDKQIEKDKELKDSPATTSFNITDFNKSVLGSHDTSFAESQNRGISYSKNVSSLMTSDSEIEEWKTENSKDVIQKEKEKIVEIEREINEIENEMSQDEEGSGDAISDDSNASEEDGSSEEDEVNDDEQESENESIESDDSESEASSGDEVISIADSSSDSNQQIDDNQETSNNRKEIEVVETGNLQTENAKNNEDSNEVNDQIQESIEGSTDPLNQAQMSLLTDDNSIYSEKSENLNYSDDKIGESEGKDDGNKEEDPKETALESEEEPIEIQVIVEVPVVEQEDKDQDVVAKSPKLSEPMEVEPIKVEPMRVTESNKTKEIAEKILITPEVPKPIETVKEIESSDKLQKTMKVTESNKTKEIAEKILITPEFPKPIETVKEIESSDKLQKTMKVTESDKTKEISKEMLITPEMPKPIETVKKNESSEKLQEHTKVDVVDASTNPAIKIISSEKTTDINETMEKEIQMSKAEENISVIDVRSKSPEIESESEKSIVTIFLPIRTRSTSSNKSHKDIEKVEVPELQTPVSRKRSQSTASNKSTTEEQNDSDDFRSTEATTPSSRRRAKTPTSTEVRKILTRRASKEITLDDFQTVSEDMTPRKRSTRSRNKSIDDNESIASGGSVKSSRSKASEDVGESKPRRGRKSMLPTKPDLSVIPELTVEESTSKQETKEDVIADYAGSRRLTRGQRTLLESWLEPKPSPRRRASAASRTSVVSGQSIDDDDDASSTHSTAFDVQPIDRMSLLNKEDFLGSPDPSETQSTISPESIASEAGKQKPARKTRAASESKSTPKARSVRRISVDIASIPELGSPISPSRGRRASFNKACEALLTPKGRRNSADVRKGEGDSMQGSPPALESDVASTTPSRRGRKTSTQSNSSQTSTGLGKRARRLSVVEETKDTTKK